MSRTISYKGKLDMGLEDKINLKTLNGKVGYKIVKFQLMSTQPATQANEFIGKITKIPETNIADTVDFTDGNVLAVNYYVTGRYSDDIQSQTIIFDNEKVNQNIFVHITDGTGGTIACNYYIELEVMSLNDLEATQLTLKSIRTITS
jgi:hypothetical protein